MIFRLIDPDQTHIAEAARIWGAGWHDAHAVIVPKQLVEVRTLSSFLVRLESNLQRTRIGVHGDEVLGFCIVKDDELDQMYVSHKARGHGLAQLLMADAENRLRNSGYTSAWLACAVGNQRAARFYEKSGWKNAGVRNVDLDTAQGTFPLPVWRFEKQLT